MRLLDLFCGAGGAAVGYHRAGFTEIVGVDIHPQPHYPFIFVQADALTYPLEGFDLVHASPSCQAHLQMSARWRGKGTKADTHANRLTPMRDRLRASAVPYILENVVGAGALMRTDVLLHGGMFGLGVYRPRRFESNLPLTAVSAPLPKSSLGVYGRVPDGRLLWRRNDGTELRAPHGLQQAQAAMGIDWMEWRELAEAIPPAYTEYLGRQLLVHLRKAA